ncbi:unnamed protein product [Dicrocoelium dendriticum]|nr:unnamed protein product [Dicrocoelium dendriticum]
MNVDVESLSDLSEVSQAASQLCMDEASVEESIKDIVAKRTDIDKRLAELSCSLPDFSAVESNARSLSSMINLASELASELSSKIRQLDLVKNRVLDCVSKLNDIIDLKHCAAEAEKALSEERYEEASGHINKFLNTKDDVLQLSSQLKHDEAAHESVTKLHRVRSKLADIIEQQFERAAQKGDTRTVERFCKLFPLIGRHDDGLKRFADHLCAVITKRCNGFIGVASPSDVGPDAEAGSITGHLDLLTQILEYIAETVRDNQVYVETYYGPGSLFDIMSSVQKECDRFVLAVLKRFCTAHRLSELLRFVQPSFTFGFTRKIQLPSDAPGASTVPESVQAERILALESIITEIVLLNTRVELYIRFMRRRLVSDAQNGFPTEEERQTKLKDISRLFDNCQTVRQMQDLIGVYISLEGYYVREMILKAVGSDELDDSSPVFRFADDVFFILKQSLTRTISSGSVDGICAMLNHTCSILLDHLVTATLTPRVRAGFPSGWMQNAYSYVQSSVAAVTPAVATSVVTSNANPNTSSAAATSSLGSSGNIARHQFLVTLNTLETCSTNLGTLVTNVDRSLVSLFAKSDNAAALQKLQACLTELKHSCSEQLNRLLDSGFDQLTTSVLRAQVNSILQPLGSTRYDITEEDLDVYAANDPWVEACVAGLETFLKPFRTVFSPGNNDRLVSVVAVEVVRRLETLIQRKSYTRVRIFRLDFTCLLFCGYYSLNRCGMKCVHLSTSHLRGIT